MSLARAVTRLLGWGGHQAKMSPRNVIFISGCDSGFGFSLALFCHGRLNMTVISACHNINSDGARLLQNVRDPKRMITIELDLLREETIRAARRQLDALLADDNRAYVFTALVNNAGVMCFGEFEWQTRDQLNAQIGVNVLGTMSLTKEMLPVLRRQGQGRIINVTSHCAFQALPGLSAYVASKAALRSWNDALRIELKPYGLEVVNFVPGSFVLASNIAARQQEHAKMQLLAFDEEQRRFYGRYFRKYHEYLMVLSGFKAPDQLQDEVLLEKFKDALTSTQPRTLYRHETWRYKWYHTLFRLFPAVIVDWLTLKFTHMPSYVETLADAGDVTGDIDDIGGSETSTRPLGESLQRNGKH